MTRVLLTALAIGSSALLSHTQFLSKILTTTQRLFIYLFILKFNKENKIYVNFIY